MKHQFYISVFTGLFIAILMNGCASSYTPNAVSIPMLNNQYEYHGAVRAGTSGVDVQNAFAVTDHIAVMANGSYSNDHSSTEKDYHKHSFGEFAIGYFNSSESKMFFECYAGFGAGKTKLFDQSGIDTLVLEKEKSHYNRFFIQPNIGYRSGRYEWGMGFRAVYINFTNFETISTNPKKTIKKTYFFEPAFIFKYDLKYVKLTSQTGINIPVDRRDEMVFSTDVVFFNFGIEVPLNRKTD